jgi:hypothetical protein
MLRVLAERVPSRRPWTVRDAVLRRLLAILTSRAGEADFLDMGMRAR